MNKKQIIILCTAVLLLLGMGAAYLYSTAPVEVARVPEQIFPSDLTQGDANAKVVVVEYASPSCPHCALWQEEVFPQVKKAYIDTGKIRYAYRFFLLPQFPKDPDVARMAMCLPKDQSLAFVDMMYRNHRLWNQTFYPEVTDADAALVRMGAIAGLSAERVAQCVAPNAEVDGEINRLAALGEAKGVDSTPSFVVDGAVINGDFAVLSAAIDAALARSEQ